jgi:hypothetical protein
MAYRTTSAGGARLDPQNAAQNSPAPIAMIASAPA